MYWCVTFWCTLCGILNSSDIPVIVAVLTHSTIYLVIIIWHTANGTEIYSHSVIRTKNSDLIQAASRKYLENIVEKN